MKFTFTSITLLAALALAAGVSLAPAQTTLAVLHQFGSVAGESGNPAGSLNLFFAPYEPATNSYLSLLYGTTQNSIFRIKTDGTGYTNMYPSPSVSLGPELFTAPHVSGSADNFS